MYPQWGGGGRMHTLTSLLRMPMHKYHPKGEGGGRLWLNRHSVPPPYRYPCISTIPKGGGSFSPPPHPWVAERAFCPPPPYGCPCISTILKGGRGHFSPPYGCSCGTVPRREHSPPPLRVPMCKYRPKGVRRAFSPPPPPMSAHV